MTGSEELSPAAFAAVVATLETDAFAAFVGQLWAATATRVTVDAPFVTVHTRSGDLKRLYTVAAGDDSCGERLARDAGGGVGGGGGGDVGGDAGVGGDADAGGDADVGADGDADADIDITVVASEALADDTEAVHTPADLRERLLYALERDAARTLCLETFGEPLVSATTVPDEPAPPETASRRQDGSVDASPETGAPVDGDTQADIRSDTTGSAAGVSRGDVGAGDTRTNTGTRTGTDAGTHTNTDAGAHTNTTTTNQPRSALAIVAVVIVLLTATVGVVSLAGGDNGTNLADTLGVGDETPGEDRSDTTDDGGEPTDRETQATSDDAPAATAPSSTPPPYYTDVLGQNASRGERRSPAFTATAKRATAPRPTCERPPLQVVQIQLNALRYADPTTNDGFETTRAFATPQNRRSVGGIEQFAQLFETPNYAPMLSYDSAEYIPGRPDTTSTTVRVITRERGNVTARYEFRLRKIRAANDSAASEYDGCWMTDSVGATTPSDG